MKLQTCCETYPFTVDGHIDRSINTQVLQLWYVRNMLHVRSITSCSKNTGNFRLRVHVMRSDQCSRRIIDQGSQHNGQILLNQIYTRAFSRFRRGTHVFFERLAEHRSNVSSLRICRTKTFRPSYKLAMIDLILSILGEHFAMSSSLQHLQAWVRKLIYLSVFHKINHTGINLQ